MSTCTLLHGDCRAVLPDLPDDAIILGDPPYGINYRINQRRSRAGLKTPLALDTEKRAAITGDDQRFDVTPWLRFPRAAFFGANHMEGLPAGGRWIVWDKRRDSTPDDHPDCELIWTSVPGADRIHRQLWRGICREGEENVSRSRKHHPNQKPVALLTFVLQQLGAKPGDLVVDPYMGSGSTAVAALRMGLRFIGAEIDAIHYATACARIGAQAEAYSKHVVDGDDA
jgi:site-specific DNA-methyltransferase (adenine-specific)